jgi:zinc transport system permease protein
MDDFLVRALVAGVGVAAVAGPMGSFVIWRRMAYFGDTLAHSALLGVALGFVLGVNVYIGTMTACALVAVALVALQRQRNLAGDTLLGILSHGGLALGLIAVSVIEGQRMDLMGYLFGDILAVTTTDILVIYGGGAVIGLVMAFIWRSLLSATVHEEVAFVEGVPVAGVRLAFMLLLALVIAVAMKIVGILLVTSLIIVPAAAVRPLARGPEQMALLAAAAGAAAVTGGLWMSMILDTPSGPSIVVAALGLFALGLLMPGATGRR